MRKSYLPILIIFGASLLVHFLYFGYPRETVFDEVHFGKFISGYFTREYFFDIHPPLGKLILSGAGYLADFRPGFSFANIGDEFPDNTYLALRFLPALAGALLPVVVYFLVLELGLSRIAAFAAGLLLVFENALLAQSRFILLDSFLLLFGFASLLCYLYYRKKQKLWLMALTAALAVFSVSVKWTGLTFLAIIGIAELVTVIRNYPRRHFGGFALLVILPPIIYFGIFAVHLKFLYKSGPGNAFMTSAFRKTLVGSPDYTNTAIQPLSLFQKTVELNKEMYRSNARLTATHPYSSRWYQWPFMTRPIYYWNQSNTDGSTMGRIYLLGNPFIWWASTFAVLYAITSLSFFRDKKVLLFLAFYAMNLLPFIDISRAMFLYHYFIAYITAVILLVYLIDRLGQQQKKKVFTAFVVASAIMFLFFAPLSYGNQLSMNAYNLRAWFSTWR